MAILTLEGIVENGQIQLRDDVTLPEHTKVYVVIPDIEPAPQAHIYNPRLGIWSKLPTLPSRFLRCRLMPSYDVSYFEPPALVARVTLRNPHSRVIRLSVRMAWPRMS